jgi:hypothetical protein
MSILDIPTRENGNGNHNKPDEQTFKQPRFQEKT